MTRILLAVALLAGVVAGAALTLTVQGADRSATGPAPTGSQTIAGAAGDTSSPPDPTSRTGAPAPSPAEPTTTEQPPVTVTTTPPSGVMLVWTPGTLIEGLEAAAGGAPGVRGTTVVRSSNAHVVETRDALGAVVDRTASGYVIPIETAEFDPDTYAPFAPAGLRALFAAPAPQSVLLSETSARLRELGSGGTLEFEDGRVFTVAAVVPDDVVGGAELAVARGEQLAEAPERYALVRYEGDRDAAEVAIRLALPAGTAVRVRGPGETPVFRHGDAVLPQAQIKERFGEFSYRVDGARSIQLDPAWREEAIVSASVPLLGRVTCHRALIPLLEGAMQELVDRGLSHIVDPATFRGCFNPRFISGRRDLSRHSWGVALDINWGANPTGLASGQDPRLVETMDRWGFTSGHDWLVPDAGHFEWHHSPIE